MKKRDTRIVLLHTPKHASWLNRVEIYFSIIQRKVLTPNDFPSLAALRLRLALYEETQQSNSEVLQRSGSSLEKSWRIGYNGPSRISRIWLPKTEGQRNRDVICEMDH